jgi:hypothetical protein
MVQARGVAVGRPAVTSRSAFGRGKGRRGWDWSADPGEATDLAARQPKLVERIAAIMRDAHVDNEH